MLLFAFFSVRVNVTRDNVFCKVHKSERRSYKIPPDTLSCANNPTNRAILRKAIDGFPD
eukprot:jgi/Phyca11/510146/fgenesh2_kg.PHYCAscaffold_54_\